MFRVVCLLALVGCGRFGFDASSSGDGGGSGSANDDGSVVDVGSLEHDEDGDGVVDGLDNCPHIVAPQTDMDGDKVGDACDPYPTVAGESIALFATMRAGDQPLMPNDAADQDVGSWTQLDDALGFSGVLGTDQNLYGEAFLPVSYDHLRVSMGLDITAVVPGSANNQNQVALGTTDQLPLYFIELNQRPGMYDVASLTWFDGTNYVQTQSADLANGIHTGPVFFDITQQANVYTSGEISWPGEPYTGGISDNVFQGANLIQVRINNLHLEIRYLIIIRTAF